MKVFRASFLRGEHPFRKVVAVLAAIAAVAAALWSAWTWVQLREWTSAAESVAATRPGCRAVISSLRFSYRGRTRFIDFRVSADELAVARSLDTGVVFVQPGPVRDAYLRTLVRTQSTSRVVAQVAAQLESIRDELGLDPDEFVELMAAFVQDVPYGTPASAFELPVQTLASGRGVCIDRSILLAALLEREGYDAGLWTLASADHVAVAVRGVGRGYRDSGYAYLETTRRAYVGEIPEAYAAQAASEPSPRLVAFGRGRRYRADAETALLLEERRRAERVARELRAYGRYAATAVGRWRAEYAAEARRQVDAAALASQLRSQADDRTVSFKLLVTLEGWSDDRRGL